MKAPRFAFVPVMDHEIHVTEWGTPGAPALIMMHGLARTGRDFDEIAGALSDAYHVLCPDMIGRGRSSWATTPDAEYTIEYYAGIATDLLDYYTLDTAAWLGTSMGGQIGMRLASGSQGDRLNCLLINDIGPEVPQSAIERIMSYIGNPPHFESHREAEVWLRSAYAPFGPASDAFWQRMARASLRRCADGRLTLHYDPRIIKQLNAKAEDLATWDQWARITAPTYVIGGAKSDLLTPDILQRMITSGPKPDHMLLDDCGHAPTLSRPADIGHVARILEGLM
ncbi:putative hydrolase or acyltransferase [Sulfitobacter noctilucae]|uniref:alpha/beta fold hydrolase n=1 Tax=Sulfitobacter noctilucae TaxID=1342302 RepID=UPI00046A6003|nr:alpha/beta hydrolase [Sulfitobacter noctilucae]KIN74942.1 putative hydrolase or acyltransferase [Sulfitobacter noctilucae]